MARDLFSVPIFFVLFRETLEASIIISVLLSMVEGMVRNGDLGDPSPQNPSLSHDNPSQEQRTVEIPGTETSRIASQLDRDTLVGTTAGTQAPHAEEAVVSPEIRTKRLVRKLRIQIWAGALSGLGIALAIGIAFICVFYLKLTNLWAKSEDLWEGIFSLIASLLILAMSTAMLKIDRAQAKWRVKLAAAFADTKDGGHGSGATVGAKPSKLSKYSIFLLPFVTVLREGIEASVFTAGVSLSEKATSIPIAAIVGVLCGAAVGYAIYRGGNVIKIKYFLVASTCLLLLVASGLFTRAVGFFQNYEFNKSVGADVFEKGDGPGSFNVQGNVWHLTYGNPENFADGSWSIFNAILGWTNNATLGTVLSYCLYWLMVIAILVYLKWKEGRVTFCGFASRSPEAVEWRRKLAAVKEKKRVAAAAAGADSSSTPEAKATGAVADSSHPEENGERARNGEPERLEKDKSGGIVEKAEATADEERGEASFVNDLPKRPQ